MANEEKQSNVGEDANVGESGENVNLDDGSCNEDDSNGVLIDEKDCCDACLCTVTGFLLLFLAIFVTYLNEHEYMMNETDISLLNDKLVTVSSVENSKIDDFSKYSNVPIYIYGSLNSGNEEMLNPFDESLDIEFAGMALKIELELYQWIEIKETESKIGQKKSQANVETTNKYRYKKKWVKEWIDSSKFEFQDNHYNPIAAEFDKEMVNELNIKPQRTVWTHSTIYIGNLPLSKKLYHHLEDSDKWNRVTMEVSKTRELDGWYERNGYLFKPYDMSQWSEFLNIENENDNENEMDNEMNNEMNNENDSKSKKKKKGPFVGDVRMSISSLDVKGEFVTFVGSIDANNTLNKFKSPISNKKYISLKYGKVSANDCFSNYQSENVYTLYFVRGLSLLISIGLFVSFSHILGYFVSHLPGKLKIELGYLYGLPFVAYSILFGTIFWIIILSIAWFIPQTQKKIAWALMASIFIFITVFHFIANKKLAQFFEKLHQIHNADTKHKTE